MVVIKIFDVDSQNNEAPFAILKVGEHVLGRNTLPNCVTQRKISRKHAIVNVEENRATLTLLHVNPCYYIPQSSGSIQILERDVPVDLTDGDKFAFLTDNWYKIEIIREESQDPDSNVTTSAIPVSNRDSSVTMVASCSGIRDLEESSPLKRSLEELNSGERKKLKTINQSLDELLENLKQIEKQDFPSKSDGDNDKEETVEMFRKKDVSDSDDGDSDDEMPAEVTKDTEIVTNETTRNSESNVKEKANLDSGEENANSKTENGESSDSDVDEKKEGTVDPSDVPKEDGKSSDLIPKQSDQDNAEEDLRKPPVDADNLNSADSNESCKQVQGDASASSSGESMANKLRREQCWYGGTCYRKNQNHREEFTHPGDSDYDRDTSDDRPECTYGAQCYRTNQLHRRQYKHPTSRPAPKPATSRLRRAATGPQTADDSSDSVEEDDNEEPFSADDSSSDNFDDDASDSDFSETPDLDDVENSEEVKIMFKEAKKFLRKKRR